MYLSYKTKQTEEALPDWFRLLLSQQPVGLNDSAVVNGSNQALEKDFFLPFFFESANQMYSFSNEQEARDVSTQTHFT